jgi:transposase
VETEIRKLFPDPSNPLVSQLRFLADRAEQLVAYQRAVDRELMNEAREIDICQRLMEIPGVGPICALTFYAAVDNPYRFSHTVEIGSYFGLTPRIRQSGLTVRKARISKMGNKSVRSLLVRAAALYLHSDQADPHLRDWTLRIEKRRGRAPSRVALARKLAVIMLAIWKSGGHFMPKDRFSISEQADCE